MCTTGKKKKQKTKELHVIDLFQAALSLVRVADNSLMNKGSNNNLIGVSSKLAGARFFLCETCWVQLLDRDCDRHGWINPSCVVVLFP